MQRTLVDIAELSWSVISTRGRNLSDNPFRFLPRWIGVEMTILRLIKMD